VGGVVQIFFAIVGAGIKIPALAAIMGSVGGIVYESSRRVGEDREMLVAQASEILTNNPPMVFGVNAVLMLVLGVILFLAAWLSALVCSFLPPKGNWGKGVHGIKPLLHLSSISK